MSQTRTHCVECTMSFVLVERSSEVDSTCADCLSKLRGPFLQCDHCGLAIEQSQPRHLSWIVLCEPCTVAENKIRWLWDSTPLELDRPGKMIQSIKVR